MVFGRWRMHQSAAPASSRQLAPGGLRAPRIRRHEPGHGAATGRALPSCGGARENGREACDNAGESHEQYHLEVAHVAGEAVACYASPEDSAAVCVRMYV